jgi:hypothetical protein
LEVRFLPALLLIVATGCGPAIFYEEVPAGERAVAEPPREAPAPPEPAAHGDGFKDDLAVLIHEPHARDVDSSTGECKASMRALRVEVSDAIELAIAQGDFRSERCLSERAQAIGTFYRVSLGFPYRDQHGQPIVLASECPAVPLAHDARACFARAWDRHAER